MLKKLYHKAVPFQIKTKIGEIRHRREINLSKKWFNNQEAYFKSHMTEFSFDETRKSDMLRTFSFLKKHGCVTFPDLDPSINKKYSARKLKIEKDSTTGLFYVLVDNKKLFYKRGLDEISVNRSFNSVSLEQDYASPHRYLSNDHYFVGVMDSAQLGRGGVIVLGWLKGTLLLMRGPLRVILP